MPERSKLPVEQWGDLNVSAGCRKRIRLQAGESYTGVTAQLPLMIWRAKEPGPVVGITVAVHGNEINGTGTIRRIIQDSPFYLKSGALVLVPVVNLFGFERHSRYMPDRRDLNRGFPGSAQGSLTARLANLIQTDVVARCDFLIDLHTAAVRRTNFPNVRGDLSDPGVKRLANVFGCEIIVDGQGPDGSLRREACRAGCPTIVLEAGEVSKVEPLYQDTALRGIQNVLIDLGMVEGTLEQAPHTVVIESTKWVRAGNGGFLEFHVAPGETVTKDQPLATNTGLLGQEHEVLNAPAEGIVLGMTTMPAVAPGDPVLHIGFTGTRREQRDLDTSVNNLDVGSLEEQVREHLATNMMINPMEEEEAR